ncbi:phosphatase PAP2 family protein [Arthrobacter sp. LAPM80]|uniref:phosphatase PAP2 family protein n=1 Tax=Arthrobacter sp. LAPM80 TaxID=3141788 RepID=UPI00398A5FE0
MPSRTPIPRTAAAALRPLDWSRAALVWASVPALALLVAGALMVFLSDNNPLFQKYDDGWNQLMLGSRTPWLTDVNRVLDFAGNDGMIIYSVALFLVLLRRHRRLAFFTAGANVGVLVLTQLIKILVARPRPENRLVHVDSGAYPSGHVSATVAAAVVTAVVIGRLWMWISAVILGIAMMYSRMYLGAHWLSDTIAGALLGAGFTLLLWAAVKNKCLNKNMPTD